MLQDGIIIISKTHICTGAVALFIGPLQFIVQLRSQWTSFHRLCGRAYILSVLISAPLAFIISFHSPNIYASSGTALQSILWLGTTLMACRAVKAGKIQRHRVLMMMSYALTLSAPFVRLGIVFLEEGLGVPYQQRYDNIYPILVWSSFFPFCLVAFFTRNTLST